MGGSVDRLSRRGDQLKQLCHETLKHKEPVLVSRLVEEAFQDAAKHHLAIKDASASSQPQLRLNMADRSVQVAVDRAAFKQALSEIIINAIQANDEKPIVTVRVFVETNGKSELCIEVEDNGTGFTPEAAQKASTPFYSARVGGIGLGLAVSRRILELHRGKFEILARAPGKPAVVRVKMPVEPVMA